MQKPKIVYIAVDDDDYELPFAMGDTMRELAEEIGVSTWDIWNCVKNAYPDDRRFKEDLRMFQRLFGRK